MSSFPFSLATSITFSTRDKDQTKQNLNCKSSPWVGVASSRPLGATFPASGVSYLLPSCWPGPKGWALTSRPHSCRRRWCCSWPGPAAAQLDTEVAKQRHWRSWRSRCSVRQLPRPERAHVDQVLVRWQECQTWAPGFPAHGPPAQRGSACFLPGRPAVSPPALLRITHATGATIEDLRKTPKISVLIVVGNRADKHHYNTIISCVTTCTTM